MKMADSRPRLSYAATYHMGKRLSLHLPPWCEASPKASLGRVLDAHARDDEATCLAKDEMVARRGSIINTSRRLKVRLEVVARYLETA